MTAVLKEKNKNSALYIPDPVIVVGAGPVAIHFVHELLKRAPDTRIKIFGEEPWEPYNRVSLTKILQGETSYDALFDQSGLPDLPQLHTYWNNRIQAIDAKRSIVTDEEGTEHFYTQLILAVGSRPRTPNIEGVELKNVFTFRDLSDTQALMSRQISSRRTVVIGSGLLGLEAAHAMQRFNTEVVCIEYSTRLMFRQLDDAASVFLEKQLREQGIEVKTNQRVTHINGKNRVESVRLASGEILECDTVILSAGIIPNLDLIHRTGIHFGQGIRVGDTLKTNLETIYAIGDCAEHEGRVYGLLSPGYEQAAVLADHLTGGQARYQGSTTAAQLKVLDYPVFSMGDMGENVCRNDCYVYQDRDSNIYRKLVVARGHLQGVIAMGGWKASNRIQEAVCQQRYIWPWQKSRFLAEGDLWPQNEAELVTEWPANATVCHCIGVNCGTLKKAITEGAKTVDALRTATGASSVCGSCQPLLQELVQSNEPLAAVKWQTLLWGSSLLSFVALLIFYLLPNFPYSDTTQTSFPLDVLWRDSLYKQISGFSLLAISLLVLLLSLRKRLKVLTWGVFDNWRLLHVIMGTLSIVAIFLHTGFRFGANLNLLLMLFFSALLLVGSFASAVIAQQHRLSPSFVTKVRRHAVWLHILLFWPIPVLLGFHIIKSYYF